MIYNTGKIPPQQADAMIDSPIDPSMLKLSGVSPSTIYEGQGDGGSRQAVLVIEGMNIVPGATVMITGAANVAVDNSHVVVSHNGSYLAVPVTVSVDSTLASTMTKSLVVQVSQSNVTATTTGLTLQGLDELTTVTATPAAVYSKIALSTDFTLPATSASTPFVLRSMSSITVMAITAHGGNASGANAGMAGAGANPGGIQVVDGVGAGGGKHGTNANFNLLGASGGDGGGGGFAAVGGTGGGTGGGAGGIMNGDDAIATYAMNTPSGGGGGGQNTATLGTGGTGGGGGGGGSIVELTAGGDLMCGAIDVAGGTGAAGPSGGGGGGGAGGVIVLRSGGALTAGMLSASGGSGGAGAANGQGNGGTGSSGRIRWDNAAVTSVIASPAAVRGPAFVSPPLILTGLPMLSLVGAPGRALTIYVNGQNATGIMLDATSGTATVSAPLVVGFNTVCAVVANGKTSSSESKDCIDLAYLP